MAEALNEIQRRVFGVLLEKALAQPQYYPMTVNAIVAACNQKSNRDPVIELDEDTVWNTLEVLRASGLISRLLPGGASRVERFRHEAKEFFGWEKPQRAILAELLLRGPQTVGELRGRCARMYPFENTDVVTAFLESLGEGETPMVTLLPRVPGQSAVRYAHRLYTPAEWARLMPAPGTPPAREPVSGVAGAARVATQVSEFEDLPAEVKKLQAEVADLRRRLETLEAGGAATGGER